MKVAIFVHCFFPEHFYGTETYTLQLAQHLKEIGHDVTVVSALFQGEPRREALVTEYSFKGLRVVCIDKNFLPHTRVKETYYQESMREVLRDLLVKIQPTIVHVAHLINHTAVLLQVAAELGIPMVATLTDFFGFCFNNKLEAADGSLCSGPNATRSNCLACYFKAGGQVSGSRLATALAAGPWPTIAAACLGSATALPGLRRGPLAGLVQDIRMRPNILATCYQNYRAVITPTRFLRSAYAAQGLGARAFDIRFGVDVQRDAKPARSVGSKVRFGFIGQIAQHKGTDILIKAFQSLPKNKAELHIFGPDDQAPAYMIELKQAAAGYNISFRGTFPGEQMADVLAQLDVLVIPSRWYENSPLALLNALATHTPVVVSDVAGLTEFIEEGVNGFRFERKSASALAHVLHRFVADPTLAARLSKTTEYTRTSRRMVEDVLPVYAFATESVS